MTTSPSRNSPFRTGYGGLTQAAVLLALASIVVFSACGDDGAPEDPIGADAGDASAQADSAVDASADVGVDPAADGGDAGSDASADAADAGPTGPPDFDAAAARAVSDWAELEAEWLVGLTDPERDDGTYDDLEDGTFRWPSLGGGAHGVRWSAAEFDENGALTNGASVLEYVVARFTTDSPTTVIVQADRAYRVWLDGRRRPGDIYGGVGVRLAYPVEAGEHWIAIQCEGRRGTPTTRAWTTTDEVAFATSDITSPHLVAGSDHVQYVGIAALATSPMALSPVRFRVLENEWVHETVLSTPGLGPGTTTQVPFELRPKTTWPSEGPVSVTVRIEAPQLSASYETTLDIEVIEPGATYRRTRLSEVDNSVQYAGIVPATTEPPAEGHGMVLTLHGAAVQGLGQARAYAAKDWATIVAPTNRRPFGFDWEVWGRLDALEALADAKEFFGHDPTRVHVTGHSMGGHGSWQLGTLFPTLFGLVGPSAGWDSFYSYGGDSAPQGVFARSQASSLTSNYATTNLANRSVYVIHGDADDNVPVREARDWVELLTPFAEELNYHEQPGAGHWWNVDPEPGADCVDWAPMFEIMEARRLDPTELDFEFHSPSPWVSPTHSFVTVEQVISPMQDFRLIATSNAGTVTLTTENVLRATFDGDALVRAGVTTVVVDGESIEAAAGTIPWGVESRKTRGFAGPFNTTFHEPFCFVYEAAGPPVYQDLAAHLAAGWSSIGNGHACTVTFESLAPWIEDNYNLVFLGVPPQLIEFDGGVSFELGGLTVSMQDEEHEFSFNEVAFAGAYPYRGRQAGLMFASDGREDILHRYSPFQSRFVLPDFMIWGDAGVAAAGFFDNDWLLDPELASGL